MKRNRSGPRLWTKDFSCITIATVLSAIGGEAMNLPISLLVFDETKSTLLSALILVCGMLPDMILPILVAPLIDKGGKKKWIVGLDVLLAAIYGLMGVWILGHTFSYGLYVGFTLTVGTISVFYRLAFSAWYPDLIPAGAEQKGYSVSSTIYPLVTILMAPVATFLYSHIPMGALFLVVSGLTVVSCLVENCIREVRKAAEEAYTLRQYRADIREGFAYLKEEKGIRNIYTYMSITQGASSGVDVLTQAYYQTQPWLTVTMLGFLKSAEMLGRVLSGFLQYVREVPVRKRYAFTKFVYRFLCGGLGCASATIRESAVQSYLPEEMRARINAFFNVISSVGGVVCYLLAGLLGQILPYRLAATILGLATLGSMFFLIVLPAKSNRPVYEAVRKRDPLN